jgi:hypothetical protein
MMRRGFWFVAGAGAGVYAVVRGRRAAEAFTAEGLADRMHGWQHGARLIREEFTAASNEREIELRERYGLLPNGARELTGPPGIKHATEKGNIN